MHSPSSQPGLCSSDEPEHAPVPAPARVEAADAAAAADALSCNSLPSLSRKRKSVHCSEATSVVAAEQLQQQHPAMAVFQPAVKPFSEVQKDENVLVCMRTQHTPQWRTLLDVLKEVIPESPVTFTKSFMKITASDANNIALVDAAITSEYYFCREETTVGLNVSLLHGVVRNLTTIGFILELLLLKNDPNHLRVRIINTNKRTSIFHKLKLLRLDEDEMVMDEPDFSRVISIQAIDFQKYIKELSFISNKIKLKVTKTCLSMSANGSKGSTTTKIYPTTNGLSYVHQEQGEFDVQGTFSAKYLEKFSRPLDKQVQIFVRENFPMVLLYEMPTAVIRFVIAPLEDEDEDQDAQDCSDSCDDYNA